MGALLSRCHLCGDPMTDPDAYRQIQVRGYDYDLMAEFDCHESCLENMVNGWRIKWGAAEKERRRQEGQG